MLEENYMKIHSDKQSLTFALEMAKAEVHAQVKHKLNKSTFRYWPTMVIKPTMINIGGKLLKGQTARLIPICSAN